MILVTGATGFLGKRVCRKLNERKLLHMGTSLSMGLDLREKEAVVEYFREHKPEYVINCASFVGGIQFGMKYPVELFQNNLQITLNLLEAARISKVRRIVNPVSNCVYPARATLFREEEIWDGPMHESVQVYGFVRKAFITGSWAYARQFGMDVLNLVLSNMYGPEDHFEEERSHAFGALVMKFVRAKMNSEPYVDVWGTGKPVREWLHVDDGAEALIRGLDAPAALDPVNVGVAEGISIADMAALIRDIVGYEGETRFNPGMPDGAAYKTVDGSKGQELLQWRPAIKFEEGARETVAWYLQNVAGNNQGISP
ncbi:MAG: NAD-dependent epimerase/dehydratase family protein [Pseudomonadales bacterium]|nr:NAD-dependent epimerase/dehydratase family protein [Pseudomonadales bacterium]